MKIENLKEVRNELNKREKVKSYILTLPYLPRVNEIGTTEVLELNELLRYKTFHAEDVVYHKGTKVYDYYKTRFDLEADLTEIRFDLEVLFENLQKCEFNVVNQGKNIKVEEFQPYKDLKKYLEEQFSDYQIKDEKLQKMTYNDEMLFKYAKSAQKTLNEKAKKDANNYMKEVEERRAYQRACEAIGKRINIDIVEKEHNHDQANAKLKIKPIIR